MGLIPPSSLSPSIASSHQVSLFDGAGVEVSCVGTILSSYLILTVASCLYGKVENGWTIKTKGHNSNGNFEVEEEEQMRRIIRVMKHPGFKTKSSKNDLAILVIDQQSNDDFVAEGIPIFPMLNSNSNETRNESTFLNFNGFSCGENSVFSPFEIAHPLKCSYSPYKSDKMCLLPVNPTAKNCTNPLPGSSLFCLDEENGQFLCGIYAFSLGPLGEKVQVYTNLTQHSEWIESASAKANEIRDEEEGESQENEELEKWAREFNLTSTIFGGKKASGPIPYQVSLRYQLDPSRDYLWHFCGGVILDKNTVVTAAHCFDTPRNLSQLFVVAGTTDLNDWDGKHQIQSVILHPDYTDFSNGSDIAIVHVETMYFYQDVQGAWILPIPTQKLSNMTAVISGWGRISDEPNAAETLQVGKVSILPPKECLDRLGGFQDLHVREGIVCASDESTRTCKGDSGGPLVIQNYKVGNSFGNLLVGVVSFGAKGCELYNQTGFFTEVSHFYDWIQENRYARRCEEEGGMLPCMTRKCYHKDWACDDDWDCPDGTDEINCPPKPPILLPGDETPRDRLMKLFATLNLPYSVVKLEFFDLQVHVHNNLGHDVNVWVTVFNRYGHFGFVDSRYKRHGYGRVYIKADEITGGVAHFAISPFAVGDIPIEVEVVADDEIAADSMSGLLKVKPDGVRRTRSKIFSFRKFESPDANQSQETRFEVKFPNKIVKGGDSVQLTVLGDAVGTMLSNLDHFFHLPATNGEQNMIKMVPNVLALDYLSATNSEANNIAQQAKKNLLSSYGHQLKYRNQDGSFSIRKSENGTTWLTAQVLRWFVAAQKHFKVHQDVIQGAIDFTLSQQQDDGSFVETGPFYHTEMRGPNGTDDVALTAYITLALIKVQEMSTHDLNLTMAIENGMNFISEESVYQLDDNYITNLVTATLMTGNHSDSSHFFEKMENGANTTTTKGGVNVKYWDTINEREGANGPLVIEMTSYALLAHLWKQDNNNDTSVFQIYNWLLNQRNPQGGFKSTQDTVLGLTALTEFALKKKGNARDEAELQLKIRASSNSLHVNDTELSVTVVRGNRMVLQEFKLPRSTKVVAVEATGNGTALVQVTESFYVPRANENSSHFKITAKMTRPYYIQSPDEVDLKVCVGSIRLNGFNRSSVASIELPSGYSFYAADYEEDGMTSIPENIERFEVGEGGSKLAVYFSSIPNFPPTCLKLFAYRRIQVANAKKASVLVYDIGNPDVQGIVSYFPAHRINVCQLCKVTNCDQEDCKIVNINT